MKPQPDLSRENQTESAATPHSPNAAKGNSALASGDGSSREMTVQNAWWKADWFRRWERLAKREG
jgi:hypothetical protein